MEQFLLKTILSLAEQFYNQARLEREMHTEFGRKGEKVIQEPTPFMGYPKEEGHRMGSRVFPGDQRV